MISRDHDETGAAPMRDLIKFRLRYRCRDDKIPQAPGRSHPAYSNPASRHPNEMGTYDQERPANKLSTESSTIAGSEREPLLEG